MDILDAVASWWWEPPDVRPSVYKAGVLILNNLEENATYPYHLWVKMDTKEHGLWGQHLMVDLPCRDDDETKNNMLVIVNMCIRAYEEKNGLASGT